MNLIILMKHLKVVNSVKRVYHHYTKWEDFQSGMYNEIKEGRDERIQKAIKCLTDDEICYTYMKKVANNWKYACEHTFTNAFNNQAFLGQCACFMYGGVRDNETRMAWGLLTPEQRYNANGIADRVYKEWVEEYEKNQDGYQFSIFDYMKGLFK